MSQAKGVIAVLVLLAACGGASSPPGTKSVDQVQSAGMSQSFAGKNKCHPKNHDRPFIIEWDATDMSNFESLTASDIVFVRYEGCDLKVLDACSDDSVKGSFGSYKPIEWTSGSLESLDIHDEGELYAKLPLGAATLGGRVQGGEKFHMEYFVSGTRTATRPAIYRGSLRKVAGCKDATHFVYGYNLGAFALGAQSNLKGTAGASAFGFSAGGNRSTESTAEKRGGVLASCRGETAKEAQACKVPIRLALRELTDGESPDAKDARATDDPPAANLAGRLKESTDREKSAAEHVDAARTKFASRDGRGCLAELDQHDQLDPRPGGLSTNTASYWAMLRAECQMLAGQCTAGRLLVRKAFEKLRGADSSPESLDRTVDQQAAMYCQGNDLTARDKILRASLALQLAHDAKKEVAFCAEHVKTLRDLLPTTPPKDEFDHELLLGPNNLERHGTDCLANAGDCAAAWALSKQIAKHPELYKFTPPRQRENMAERAKWPEARLRSEFDGSHPKCAAR